MKSTRKIKIIGAGGIGCYVIEPLCRYLSFIDDYAEITVIDGDKYEERNRQRQRFTNCNNKADETVQMHHNEFPRIHMRSKSEFITEDNVISTIRENDTVFLCVDNHATRKIVSDRCQELNNVTLISGGNEETDGNVIVYIRKDGQDITKSPTELFASIANPQDVNPGDEVGLQRDGCQQQAESKPQLLFMNLAIASMMLNCYRKCERNEVDFHQVFVDIHTLCSKPSPQTEKEFTDYATGSDE